MRTGPPAVLPDRETGEIRKEQAVHIFQPGHAGERMCMDERMIGKRCYTVFSNHESDYIALMTESIRPVPVKEALLLSDRELPDKVRYITAGMSRLIKNICEAVLPQARIITDKFHVIKHLMEAQQSVRLQVKREIQTERKRQKRKTERAERGSAVTGRGNGQSERMDRAGITGKDTLPFTEDASGTGRGRCFFTGFHIR
jgi:hypothetical protein